MPKFIKAICVFLALFMSYFIVGDPNGYEVSVNHPVTTETKQFKVDMKNKTGEIVYDPLISSLETEINGEWVEIGCITEREDVAKSQRPLVENYGRFHLENMDLYEPLSEGNYRVVVSFAMKENKIFNWHKAYAYFTVMAL